jgi:transposase-like protein
MNKEKIMSRIYGPEEKAKLVSVINQGAQVLQEVDDLKGGLRDTIKAIAEELDIKPSLLTKAVNVAYKSNWQKVNSEFEELENILVTTGKDA